MSLVPHIFLFIPDEWCTVRPKLKTKEIEKYFIALLCIFQIYVNEIIESAQMICLLIARLNSDRKYSGCVVIS
jgi:hypothetical protein